MTNEADGLPTHRRAALTVLLLAVVYAAFRTFAQAGLFSLPLAGSIAHCGGRWGCYVDTLSLSRALDAALPLAALTLEWIARLVVHQEGALARWLAGMTALAYLGALAAWALEVVAVWGSASLAWVVIANILTSPLVILLPFLTGALATRRAGGKREWPGPEVRAATTHLLTGAVVRLEQANVEGLLAQGRPAPIGLKAAIKAARSALDRVEGLDTAAHERVRDACATVVYGWSEGREAREAVIRRFAEILGEVPSLSMPVEESPLGVSPGAPSPSVVQSALVGLIRGYRERPGWLGLERSCAYTPSCSHYAEEAILAHGPWRGLLLALGRMLRCNPSGPGGKDPVPLI
jgi:putative membrane protein insertion efficiency factor